MSTLRYKHTDYHALINLFQTMAKRFESNVYAHYQVDTSEFKTLTYEQVDRITTNLACKWAPTMKNVDTVGFIADHSIHYLLSMIAILKLRTTLLALSPRNSEAANVNLLNLTGARVLLVSEKHKDMAESCAQQLPDLKYDAVKPFDIDALVNEPLLSDWDTILDTHFSPEDEEKIALIIHSSGTTSFPKPIRLSNRYLFHLTQTIPQEWDNSFPKQAATQEDVSLAAYPLFHVYGCLTTFGPVMYGTSVVLLARLPPTPSELTTIIEKLHVTFVSLPPLLIDQLVTYLNETQDFAPWQKLKILLYGGAALKKTTGDYLHNHDINVRNAYGSTEINAMSMAHMTNNCWDTLRPLEPAASYAEWEPVDKENGVYHLVIKAGCPCMATGVANRPNGDYATKDLFKEDPPNSGYWRHLGRNDDTLVMENGEKTNPTPMEHTISSSPLVKQCTVIGENRPCTAALVELDVDQALRLTPQEMIDEVQRIVSKANKDAPSHSTILPQMVYILPLEKRLPSTDKGTIMRKHAIREYESVINKMYDDFLNGATDQPSDMRGSTSGMTLEQIESFLVRTASQVLQIKEGVLANNKQESLFDHGLNSLLAIQLRNRISSSFGTVPSNFIFEHPTIESAAQSLHSSDDAVDTSEERYQDTQQLLKDYITRAKDDFCQCKTTVDDPRAAEGHVILLTGATGSLGSFMLSELLQSSHVKKVYCLVRGQQDQLMDRLYTAFRDRFLDTRLLDNGKVEALPMKLNEDYLGWSKDTYDRLKQQVTIVQACAWLLDFNQPIAHFDKECIQGLYNLLKFAHRPINPMHVHTISSVSATAAMKSPIQEVVVPEDPHVAMPMGYAQSKYIVEHLFYFLSKEKGFPCTIERLGQVCGDTQHGFFWNTSEQYPLMMVGGGAEMKKMPDFGNMVINWIPVDYAAASIVQIMLKTASNDNPAPAEQVYHIVNPNRVTWRDVLEAMRVSGMQFDVVKPEQWVEDLSENQENPAYRLMSFYEANFVGEETMSMPVWETKQTVKVAPALTQAPAFDSNLMSKYLSYWRSIGFYK